MRAQWKFVLGQMSKAIMWPELGCAVGKVVPTSRRAASPIAPARSGEPRMMGLFDIQEASSVSKVLEMLYPYQ